jgi:hypothetical protein
VKNSAKNELDDSGRPVPVEKRIVVFPGIELTLTAPNCQALLILDADFADNLLQSVLTALAITPAQSAASKHATVQRIPQNVVGDLTDLYAKLNSHEHLRGRFTVFPNVTENGIIKADVKGGLNVGALKQKCKIAFASLNIQERKLDDLCAHVLGASDPMVAWNGILAELEGLAIHNASGTDPMPTTAVMDRCGFIGSEKSRLAAGFDSTRWLELSTVELEFNPVFQYSTNKVTGEFIAFADASAGQQATALLTVLLNQQGAPLIIDQPEDHVDSKMSPDIVQQIWKAKSRRQLIFASHNANFVVNGDAELVVCCDYVKAGDQTGGQIKAVGAIDNADIRDEITAVTEGGKEAFKLRKEKYGF